MLSILAQQALAQHGAGETTAQAAGTLQPADAKDAGVAKAGASTAAPQDRS